MFISILAMSEYQKEIRRELVSKIKLVDQHLLKCWMFPKHADCSHWKQEAYNFVNDVDKVKGKNKYPSYKFIREAFSTHEDVLYNYIYLNRNNYKDAIEQDFYSDSELVDKVIAYHDWLAYELSSRGKVTRYSVYAILDGIYMS